MEAILSGIVSFTILHFMSHPSSRFNKSMPSARYKRFSLSPRFSFEAKNKIFHLHHWMVFGLILLATQIFDTRFIPPNILYGFLLGGILQGLMYKDSFKFFHHAEEFHSKVKTGSYHKFSFLRRIIN